jgi:membrane protease subunit HflK
VLVDVEGGNNVMYLPLDKMMQNNAQRQTGTSDLSSGTLRLDDQSLRNVTNQVVDQIRQNQTSTIRREGRQ